MTHTCIIWGDFMFWAEIKKILLGKRMRVLLVLFCLYSLITGIASVLDPAVKETEEVLAMSEEWDFSDRDTVESSISFLPYNENAEARISYVLDMQEKLQSEKEILEKKKDSVLFSSEKAKAEIDAEITAVSELMEWDWKPVNDIAVLHLFSLLPADFLAMLGIGLYMVYQLFVLDDEDGLLRLYESTVVEKNRLVLARLGAVLTVLCVLMLGRYALELAFTAVSGISPGMPMQALYEFGGTDAVLSVSKCFLELSLIHLLSIAALLLLFASILVLTGSSGIAAASVSLLLLVEFTASKLISASSAFAPLVEINLWTALTIKEPLEGFAGVGSLLFRKDTALMLVLLFLCLLSSVLIVRGYGTVRKRGMVRGERKTFRLKSFSFFQWKEILLREKGIILFLIVCGYGLYSVFSYSAVRSSGDVQYEKFRESYYGELNDELMERVETELSAAEKADADLLALLEEMGETMTDEQAKELDQLQEMRMDLPYLQKLYGELLEYQAAGSSYYYVSEGLDLFVNRKGSSKSIAELAMIVFIPLLLGVSVLSPLFQSSLGRLAFSTKKGKRKVISLYLGKLFLYALILYVCNEMFRYFRYSRAYSIFFAMESAASVLGIPCPLPLVLYLILLTVLRLLVIAALLVSTVFLSEKMDRLSASLCMGVLAAVCTVLPYGPGIVFRYDPVNHPVQLIAVAAGAVIVILLGIRRIRVN